MGAKTTYIEGAKAGENFERLARAVFQAPKVANPKKRMAKPTARKKTAAGSVVPHKGH